MSGSLLLVVALVVQSPPTGPDPSALVVQLGATRFADRQAAAEALEKLGRDALPALREARNSADPEVKARALDLLTRVEGRLLLEPTTVRLDFRDQPLTEVVAAIASRTGIPLRLQPENNPAFASRRISLEAPEPVPFWDMLERLTEAGSVLHGTNLTQIIVPGGLPQAQVFPLYDGSYTQNAPRSISGLFRTSIQSIRVHRDLNFLSDIRMGGRAIIPNPNGANIGDQAGFVSNVQFTLDLNVAVEPRMIVGVTGPARIDEAIDDLGQSLLSDASAEVQRRMSGYFGGFGTAQSSLSTQIQLQLPERMGRSIKRLRGTLPVRVAARKDEPVIIALDQAKGKPIPAGDLQSTSHEVRPAPDGDGSTQIELSARPSPNAAPASDPNSLNMTGMMFRSPQMAQNQVEILDARDRPYPQWLTTSMQVNNDEARMTLRLMANEQLGPPVRLRIYDLARANTDVSFSFEDIPMP
jgi:hypothetical protein